MKPKTKETAKRGSRCLKRLVRRPTIVQDDDRLILLVPFANRWDKYVWHNAWDWDDQISDGSARQWLMQPHYVAPNASNANRGLTWLEPCCRFAHAKEST